MPWWTWRGLCVKLTRKNFQVSPVHRKFLRSLPKSDRGLGTTSVPTIVSWHAPEYSPQQPQYSIRPGLVKSFWHWHAAACAEDHFTQQCNLIRGRGPELLEGTKSHDVSNWMKPSSGSRRRQGMSAAANYAWVNRSSMTFLTRQAFAKAGACDRVCVRWAAGSAACLRWRQVFNQSPEDLDMHVIYEPWCIVLQQLPLQQCHRNRAIGLVGSAAKDVSHNIAKVEEHFVAR